MKRNILLTIEYDGTHFHGWQRQPGTRTCQGELERVLSILCAQEITIEGTSRTDAGVHALDQKATLRGDFSIPAENIPPAANNLLSGGRNSSRDGDIRIVSAVEAADGFHARFSCRGKKYIYRIRNSRESDVFGRDRYWRISEKLDTDAMRNAAQYITVTHDFACFQAAGGQERESTVRTVFGLDVIAAGDDIEIHIEGDGFLYNMVRIIAGTLAEAGRGRIAPEYIKEIIEGRDRTKAGPTAPPQGLYLAKVYY